jgi:pimeloyl-ACP methyl ester carboxylesterase
MLSVFPLLLTSAAASIAQPIVSESKFVDLDHLKVHYANYGKGETALVFVHGWASDDYPEAAAHFADAITKPMKDAALGSKVKALFLKTLQHVAISEFEATVEENLWKPDKIDVPVLMILAKQPAWSADYEQFGRNLIPNLDFQMWENVSHFLMMDKPREFNAAVLKFLEQNQLLARK